MKQNVALGLALVAVLGVGYLIYNNSNEDGHEGHDHSKVEGELGVDPLHIDNEDGPAEPELPATVISFTENEHDYGDIYQDTKNEHIFKFKNTGEEPLVISNAVGSCGCTVPEYPKEPIAPGAESEIKVVFSPGKKEGAQTKNVTITANTDPKQTKIVIKANVLKVED